MPQPYPPHPGQSGPPTPTAFPAPKPASFIEPKPARSTTARIALAHDWLVGLRGGEGVLDAIVRTIHATPGLSTSHLYTLFADGQPLTDTLDALPTRVSGLSRLPDDARRWLLPAYPLGVRQLTHRLAQDHRAQPIDLLLSSSSVAAKAVRPPPGVPHLCYCHTPARYLWDQRPEYTRGHPLRAAGLALAGPPLRAWDRRSTQGVTTLLANSAFTAERIRRFWGRDAEVLHPPIDTDYFTPDPATPREDFWLVVSALEPYKRVDLAIDAATRARHPLRIVGAGSQTDRLRARAAGSPRITFEARVDRERLRTLYRTARVLLFPQVEDFGMAAAEAQACGCPVVARAQGGAAEIVIDGSTGAHLAEPTVPALLDAIDRLPDHADEACRTGAQRFSADRFAASIIGQIRGCVRAAR